MVGRQARPVAKKMQRAIPKVSPGRAPPASDGPRPHPRLGIHVGRQDQQCGRPWNEQQSGHSRSGRGGSLNQLRGYNYERLQTNPGPRYQGWVAAKINNASRDPEISTAYAHAALVIDKQVYDELTPEKRETLKAVAGTSEGGIIVLIPGLRGETLRTMHAANNALTKAAPPPEPIVTEK
jgi:hypothetical protein